VLFGALIAFGIVRFRYEQISNVLKWLTVSVFAYIITAFIIHPNWSLVAKDTFHFTLPRGKAMAETVVAILGTTISPYLFYWQAGQEIEETRARSRRLGSAVVSERLIGDRRIDVSVGALLSNTVMFFVILAAALTLHRQGLVNITTSRQAAEALRPLAGNFAMLLYTVGIVALGLLAIPTLAGSSAYALAETFGWADGLDDMFKQAEPFYGIILFSMLVGVGLNFMHIAPLSALFWTAVINGILAPFLILGIFMVASDPVIMKGRTSSRVSQVVVLATGICMFAAAIAMFLV
jgi:Mn2+/Fe2+ NRAMP family transporter